MSIDAMRRNFDMGSLHEKDASKNPIEQFRTWFNDAIAANKGDWFEPNAMTLATVDPSGMPDARIVLLKSFDERGFVFFTNYESIKAKQLEEHPYATLVFYWPNLERQVRITGKSTKTSDEVSSNYFASRPHGSQLGAIVSNQSSVIPNREFLETKLKQLAEQYKDISIPRPTDWGGYCIKAHTIEFWQGRPNRLHDRLQYILENNGKWSIQRLAP
ncbi:pyridoxamine 5'-phosphate oxidase [Planctomycetota bacterium]|nr:pyridoxamine 5'-phosphate oxidase [Planctomycetota bacterium]